MPGTGWLGRLDKHTGTSYILLLQFKCFRSIWSGTCLNTVQSADDWLTVIVLIYLVDMVEECRKKVWDSIIGLPPPFLPPSNLGETSDIFPPPPIKSLSPSTLDTLSWILLSQRTQQNNKVFHSWIFTQTFLKDCSINKIMFIKHAC